MKKGFVHMIEVIVVIIMAFFAFFQFAYITTPETDWERTKLTLLGNDALSVMEKTGINWFDENEVSDSLDDLISSSNIIYGIRLDNIIKENITIGCLCSDEQILNIENALLPSPMLINDERINFRIIKVDNLNELLNPYYDIALLGNYQGLSLNNARRFLQYDKGIVEIFMPTESQVLNDPVQRDIFGLGWSADSPSTQTGRIIFAPESYKPGPESYMIYKYFHSFPNTTGDGGFPIGTGFDVFMDSGSGVVQVSENPQKVVVFQRDSGKPACIINHEISEKKGRTAWIPMNSFSNEEEKNLFKSVISWAAGKNQYIKKTSSKNPVVTSIYKVYNRDMFQIIKIELILDYL